MREATHRNSKILLIDDQEANLRLLERILQPAGYTHLKIVMDSRKAMSVYAEFSPDLILLDLHMPHLDGMAVMEQLRPAIPRDAYVPILVLTADMLAATKRKALAMGAKDFLIKPYDTTEVLLRIHNLLETRFLYLMLREHNETLEFAVRQRTSELEQAQAEMLDRLARASESRDDDTGQHTQRVGELSGALARAAGLPADRCELIRRAAALHDIGKIGISDGILLKPGKLTPEEFTRIKKHTSIGAGILSGSRFPMVQLAEEIARYHHEKWDGTGYCGIRGESIPLAARIVTLADVFDVLTHSRPYKQAWPLEQALAEIDSHSGRMFDPQLVELFLRGQSRMELQNLAKALTREEREATTSDLVWRR